MKNLSDMTICELEEIVEFGYGDAAGRLEALVDTLVSNGVLSKEQVKQAYIQIVIEEKIEEDLEESLCG